MNPVWLIVAPEVALVLWSLVAMYRTFLWSRWRDEILDMVSTASDADIASRRAFGWRFDYLRDETPSAYTYSWLFWRRIDSFVGNWSFVTATATATDSVGSRAQAEVLNSARWEFTR